MGAELQGLLAAAGSQHLVALAGEQVLYAIGLHSFLIGHRIGEEFQLFLTQAECLRCQFAARGRAGQFAGVAPQAIRATGRRLNAAPVRTISARPRPSAWALNSRFGGPGPQWGPFRTDRAGRRDWRLNAAPVRIISSRARRRRVKFFAQLSRKKAGGALVPSGHRPALDRGGSREGAAPYGLSSVSKRRKIGK